MRRDVWIALLAVAAGVGTALLVLGSDRERSPLAVSAVVALVVGWAFVGSGLVARRQRPENPLGTVMVSIGFAWFATFLVDAESSFVFTVGKALESLYLLGFVYLVLSFPTGRLRSTVDRALVAAAVALVMLVEVVWLLFADARSQICSGCPANAFEITRNDDVATAIPIGLTAGVVTAAATVMVAVFALFGTLSSLELKQAGFGLAAAVLVDATLIRGVLLPATMKLLGDWNWYLPKQLHRLAPSLEVSR